MGAHGGASATWTSGRVQALLREMFTAAVASADPAKVLSRHLPAPPQGRCVVVGAGKAAAAMAAAVEAAWSHVPLSGVVVAPYGHGLPSNRIKILEAAHPVPDANSEAAAREVLAAVQGLSEEDLVLALISGGGSSVLALPGPGLTLADKQITNRVLLDSGVDIRTMNLVRRRLSAIKGGRLAAAAMPARVVTLAISDIPGDDPSAIASGPTALIADGEDLRPVVESLGARLPAAVVRRLSEPPRPVQPSRAEVRLIATPAAALDAAAAIAAASGLDVLNLGDALEGESCLVGAEMANFALGDVSQPSVLLSGGETTVTIADDRAGRGGRNTEFLLALGVALNGAPGVWALAADTDGEDGASGGAAGAMLTPDTLRRGQALGLDAPQRLEHHDSGGYFEALGDLIVTGPTRTNVNDFRAIAIIPERFRH